MVAVTIVLSWLDFLLIFLIACLAIFVMRRVP
jgi:hypothetical protein